MRREPVGRVSHPDPEVFDYRIGAGCSTIFGLPFLLGGMFALVLVFIPEARRARDVPDWYLLAPCGALVLAIGVLLVFTRRGTVVDCRNERVVSWWGLLRPMRSSTRPLADFDRVEMTERLEKGRRRSYTVYPVRLVGERGLPVTVDDPLTPAGALEVATGLARFTGLKLVDRTTGTPIVRLAADGDKPLRQRQEESGRRVSVPEPPADARSRIEVLGDTISFELPAPGLRGQHAALMAVGLLVPAGVYFFWLRLMFGRGALPAVISGLLAVVLMGAPFVFFFLLPLSAARMRTRVEASPTELRVTFRGLLLRRSKAILAHVIDEVEVADLALTKGQPDARGKLGSLIVVRAGGSTLAFGAGLSQAELTWIRSVLWNVVTA